MSSSAVPEYRTAYLRKALGDRYTFEGFLGKGAFAAVYLVRNRRLERLEALKVLAEAYDGDDQFALRFVDEAKLIASLSHPNIVPVHDYGEVDGVLWYSMQYVQGPTLRKELETRERFEAEDVARLAVPLLDALEYSHQQGIIHRDIKPGNVLLTAEGRPFLMDFGIAKVKGSNLKTQTGSLMGTPAYIAPEQAAGEPVDARCDLYSLGTMMYELLVGYAPFTSNDPLRTLVRRLKEDPRPPRDIYPEFDPEMERIVLACLTRHPEDRYQSAALMAEDLLAHFREPLRTRYAVRAPADAHQPLESYGPDDDPDGRGTDPDAGAVADLREREAQPSDSPPVQARELPLKVDPYQSTVTVTMPEARSERRTRRLTVLAGLFLLMLGAAFAWSRLAGRGSDPPSSRAAEVVESVGGSSELDPREESREPAAQSSDTNIPGSSEESVGAEAADVEADSDEIDPGASTSPSGTRRDAGPAPLAEETSSRISPEPTDKSPTSVAPPPASTPEPPVMRRALVFPKLDRAVAPTLSVEDAQMGGGETVLLTVVIDDQGRVSEVRAHEGSSPEVCEQAAKEAAKEYTFHPALDAEHLPIEARTTISVDFESFELEKKDL